MSIRFLWIPIAQPKAFKGISFIYVHLKVSNEKGFEESVLDRWDLLLIRVLLTSVMFEEFDSMKNSGIKFKFDLEVMKEGFYLNKSLLDFVNENLFSMEKTCMKTQHSMEKLEAKKNE